MLADSKVSLIFATFEYLELQFAGTSFGRGVPFFMNLTEVLRFLYLYNNYFILIKYLVY